MKGQRIFPSIILIGFGLFYFLQDTLSPLLPIFHWPSILAIVGIAFLVQSYAGKDYGLILPGVLFIGLGIHFHVAEYWNIQLDHIGVIILFISLGFFLLYQKTGAGLFYGWLFLVLASLQLFSESIFQWLESIETKLTNFYSLWPILIILVGFSLLFFKRK